MAEVGHSLSSQQLHHLPRESAPRRVRRSLHKQHDLVRIHQLPQPFIEFILRLELLVEWRACGGGLRLLIGFGLRVDRRARAKVGGDGSCEACCVGAGDSSEQCMSLHARTSVCARGKRRWLTRRMMNAGTASISKDSAISDCSSASTCAHMSAVVQPISANGRNLAEASPFPYARRFCSRLSPVEPTVASTFWPAPKRLGSFDDKARPMVPRNLSAIHG